MLQTVQIGILKVRWSVSVTEVLRGFPTARMSGLRMFFQELADVAGGGALVLGHPQDAVLVCVVLEMEGFVGLDASDLVLGVVGEVGLGGVEGQAADGGGGDIAVVVVGELDVAYSLQATLRVVGVGTATGDDVWVGPGSPRILGRRSSSSG